MPVMLAQCLLRRTPTEAWFQEPVLQDSISTAMHADDQQSQEPDIWATPHSTLTALRSVADSFNE
ncbi:MAG: hypothetical protein U0T56_12675 [Ferruginibacter sp.]